MGIDMSADLGTLYDDHVRHNPFSFFAKLQDQKPVYQLPGTDIFLVSSYQHIREIVKDVRTFSNEHPKGITSFHNFSRTADEILETQGFGRKVKTIANNDPPSHYLFRRLFSTIITPRLIRELENKIKRDVSDILDDIDTSRPFDIVHVLMTPIPLFVIAEIVGVDRSDYQKFKRWASATLYQNKLAMTESDIIEDVSQIAELQHYLVEVIRKRKAQPGGDAVSKFIATPVEGDKFLTEKEILSILELLIGAGAETTTNSIANALLYMIDNPDAEREIRQDPGKIDAFVEEMLRLESSVVGIWRFVTEDTVVGTQKIPKGSKILLSFLAADQDPEVFENPRIFNMDRNNLQQHIAFGSGIHTCPGNSLARMEMKAVFGELLRRYSTISLAVPRTEIEYLEFLTLRGPKALHVTVTPGGRLGAL